MKKIITVFALLSLLFNFNSFAQTPVADPPGTTVTESSADSRAVAWTGGQTYTYTNPSWPDWNSPCYTWGYDKLLTGIINGYNTAPPGNPCSNMRDLTYSASSSNLAGGIIVFTGTTTYRYLNTSGFYVTNTSVPVRLTATIRDASSNAIPVTETAGNLLIRAEEDFNVHVILEALSPGGAMYFSGGPGVWYPAIYLFNILHTDPNSSVCTDFSNGSFYTFTVNATASNTGPYCENEDIYLYSGTGTDYSWIGPNAYTSTDQNPIINNALASMSGIYTVTVTDAGAMSCLNTADTEVIVILDTEKPDAICQNITVELDASGNASITAADIDNGSTDNCGIASMSLDVTDFTCADLGTNVTTLTVTDIFGNSDFCVGVVEVVDNIAPVAVTQDITVQLDALGNASITPEEINNGSTDNCGIDEMTLDVTSFDCSDVGSKLIVTLTVTDASGNSDNATAVVTVEDNIAPQAICSNIIIQLDDTGNATITAADIDNGSNDACGIADLSISQTDFSCADVGAKVNVVLTVTDVNGNVSTCTSIVTVQDNIPPDAICQDITVELDATGTATIVPTDLDNGSTDNCGIDSFDASQTEFSCFDVGAKKLIELTVTDINGNSSVCTSNVTVEDNIAPNAVCRDITVQLDATGNATVLPSDIDNGSTDACGIANMSLSQTDFSCADVGAKISVTLTVTDVNGNVSSCSSNVTVEDNIAPDAICQNITVQLDASGNATITAADIDNGSTDACGIADLTISQTDFTCDHIGANTVALTVTDVNGNSSVCTSIVTVEDNIVPNAVCQNITVQLDETGNVTVSASDIDNGSTDACGIASLSLSQTDFTCSDVGANNVILTVTDNNGNISTCNAIVTVEDNIAPDAICQDITVQLDASGNATITAADIDNGSTDACGIADLSVSQTDFTCSDIGANTVTLTVTDVNGNVSACDATVIVEDNIAPVAICQDITVQLDASGNVSITPADIDNGSNDACGISNMTVSPSEFSCSDVGANTVTLTVTDNYGNVSSCNATVNVEDNIAPNTVCQNITIQLDALGNASITPADIDNGSSDACGIADLSVSQTDFTCSDVGVNTVTLTATDVNGNSSFCDALVTVEDNISPDAICQDITVQLDATGHVSITAADIDNGSNDACGIGSLAVSQSDFYCAHVGDNSVVLIVTDVNGNISECTATVTVEDNIAPNAVCNDLTIYLDASGNASITAEDVDHGSNDACGIASLSVSQTDFTCDDLGPNNVTLTVTDNNGNISTCTSVVTVVDDIDPSVTCVADQNRDIDPGSCFYTVLADEFDPVSTSDNCSSVTIVNDFNNLSSLANAQFPIGETSVIWIVTDQSGNSDECGFTVIVTDNEMPTITCPDNITQNTNPYSCEAFVEVPAPLVDDNCGIGSVFNNVTGNSSASGIYPLGINEIIWTVQDLSGNTNTCTMEVEIIDDIDPVADEAADIEQCTDDGSDYALVYFSDPTGTDNCSSTLDVNQTAGLASGSQFPVGTVTNEFELSDESGNTTTVSFDVTVLAQSLPAEDLSSTNEAYCIGDVNSLILTYHDAFIGGNATPVWYYDENCTDTIGTGNNIEIIAPEISTTYYFRIEGSCNTTEVQPITITVYELPVIDAGEDITLILGQSYQLNPEYNENFTYLWSPPDYLSDINIYNPLITANITTLYELTVTDNNGCSSSDMLLVTVEKDLKIYTGFTPNNDGINEYWHIDGIEIFPDNIVKVFNRAGELVFEATNYQNNWDGTRMNDGRTELPVGTYYYIIKIGEEFPVYKGNVTIMK